MDGSVKTKKLQYGADGLRETKQTERFLKGPIAMRWLNTAACLGGKALHVAVHLAHLFGMVEVRGAGPQPILLNLSRLKQISVNRDAGSRALRKLEDAGLVQVERHSGRCPRVTIVGIRP